MHKLEAAQVGLRRAVRRRRPSPQAPLDWGDPEESLNRTQFFDVLQMCVEKLPTGLARIFMMREWLEYETAEICKELGITSTNCFVMLFRARMRLRECLEMSWFAGEAKR